MIEKFYFVPFKSVLGSSILQYCAMLNFMFLLGNTTCFAFTLLAATNKFPLISAIDVYLILKLSVVALIGEWLLKEEGAYFKGRIIT